MGGGVLICLSDNVDIFHGRQSDFRPLAALNVCRVGYFLIPLPQRAGGFISSTADLEEVNIFHTHISQSKALT